MEILNKLLIIVTVSNYIYIHCNSGGCCAGQKSCCGGNGPCCNSNNTGSKKNEEENPLAQVKEKLFENKSEKKDLKNEFKDKLYENNKTSENIFNSEILKEIDKKSLLENYINEENSNKEDTFSKREEKWEDNYLSVKKTKKECESSPSTGVKSERKLKNWYNSENENNEECIENGYNILNGENKKNEDISKNTEKVKYVENEEYDENVEYSKSEDNGWNIGTEKIEDYSEAKKTPKLLTNNRQSIYEKNIINTGSNKNKSLPCKESFIKYSPNNYYYNIENINASYKINKKQIYHKKILRKNIEKSDNNFYKAFNHNLKPYKKPSCTYKKPDNIIQKCEMYENNYPKILQKFRSLKQEFHSIREYKKTLIKKQKIGIHLGHINKNKQINDVLINKNYQIYDNNYSIEEKNEADETAHFLENYSSDEGFFNFSFNQGNVSPEKNSGCNALHEDPPSIHFGQDDVNQDKQYRSSKNLINNKDIKNQDEEIFTKIDCELITDKEDIPNKSAKKNIRDTFNCKKNNIIPFSYTYRFKRFYDIRKSNINKNIGTYNNKKNINELNKYKTSSILNSSKNSISNEYPNEFTKYQFFIVNDNRHFEYCESNDKRLLKKNVFPNVNIYKKKKIGNKISNKINKSKISTNNLKIKNVIEQVLMDKRIKKNYNSGIYIKNPVYSRKFCSEMPYKKNISNKNYNKNINFYKNENCRSLSYLLKYGKENYIEYMKDLSIIIERKPTIKCYIKKYKV